MSDYGLMQIKYDDIWNHSKPAIESNNVTFDANLLDISKDKRLGLTLLIPIEGGCLEKVAKLGAQLSKAEPDQYYYPLSDLHITVLDFIGASKDFVFNEKQVDAYKKVLCDVLRGFPRFVVKFDGLVASDAAIIVQGFSDVINQLRERLRNEMDARGVTFEERYKATTSHMTIARFKNELRDSKSLIGKIESMRHLDLCSMEVYRLVFVLHDWYNRMEKTKILVEYELTR